MIYYLYSHIMYYIMLVKNAQVFNELKYANTLKTLYLKIISS